MKILGLFYGILLLVFSLLLVAELLFDRVVLLLSYDYVPQAAALQVRNLSENVLLAAVLAAACVLPAGKPWIGFRKLVWLGLGGTLLVVISTFAASCAYYLGYIAGFLNTEHWQLAYPARHAAFLGSTAAFQISQWLAVAAVSVSAVTIRYRAQREFRLRASAHAS